MTAGSSINHFLRHLAQTWINTNVYYVLTLVFIRYTRLKLEMFKKIKVSFQSLPDSTFVSLIDKYFDKSTCYIDPASCGLGVVQGVTSSEPTWVNICSLTSTNKYRVLLMPFTGTINAHNDQIYLSESTLFNVNNLLAGDNNFSYFVLPACDVSPQWAREIKISLIRSPHSCPQDLIDTLLKNYFSRPRYLRKNDIFSANVKEYARQYLYTLSSPQMTVVYFKVKSIKLDGTNSTLTPCYAFHDKSTLFQESSIFEYLPQKNVLPIPEDNIDNIHDEITSRNISNLPLPFFKPLHELRVSILPFRQSDDWQGLKPIFLVEGPSGCGKFKIIECLSQRLGFNLINVDCNDLQSVSASQTEAKLRIAINNAENAIPCILKLSNIQMCGRNSEGKIDERITSNFAEQLENVFEKNLEFPLIIIATLEADEVPSNVSRIFIDKVRVDHLTQDERVHLLEWFLKTRKMQHQADLSKIAGMCADYLYSDLETLTLEAAKHSYKRSLKNERQTLIVNHQDFLQACEYMQSTFSDRIGAAKVPQVYWEDIGGLAKLKHEIIRRIEIPLLNNLGIQSSGILLYGPPGTGKTLLAKAVATECKLHFLSVKGPELLNMYVGQSEKNVRDIFEKARVASPCIIFFDELDALAPNRGRSGDSGGVMDRVVSQLLAEMDGLDTFAKTFIIAATNRPDLIDPALLRPGRFDKLLYVGIYSDPESQLSVLKAVTRKFAMENNVDLEEIVKELPKNLTGADLHSVCSNAWLNAARRIIQDYEKSEAPSTNKKPDGPITVLSDDLFKAARALIPSVSDQELSRYNQLNNELTLKKQRP